MTFNVNARSHEVFRMTLRDECPKTAKIIRANPSRHASHKILFRLCGKSKRQCQYLNEYKRPTYPVVENNTNVVFNATEDSSVCVRT